MLRVVDHAAIYVFIAAVLVLAALFLLGTGHQRQREFLIHEAGNGASIIRGNMKLVRPNKGDLALYDLAADHAEENDLAADRPDLVEELEALLGGDVQREFTSEYYAENEAVEERQKVKD